jgi:hypothetical protein
LSFWANFESSTKSSSLTHIKEQKESRSSSNGGVKIECGRWDANPTEERMEQFSRSEVAEYRHPELEKS